MSKRQRRFIYYSSPLVVLFVVFLAVRMKLNAVEANAQMLAQMGQAAQKVLGEYREGVERADASKVLSCFDDAYASEREGLWSEELQSERDGVRVYEWKQSDMKPFAKRDEGEQGDADPQGSRGHQLGERAARCRLQVRREPRRRECSRRHPRTRRGKERRCELAPERQARLDILRRAGEQIGRVVGQLVASVPVGDRRLDDRGIRSRHRDDLLPSGAIGKVRVAVVERRRGPEMSDVRLD